MIYLIYGTIDYLIEEYINKLLHKEKINEINISKYNLEDNINDIIDDAMTMSMFGDKKAIIVNAKNLFTLKKEIDINKLQNYLKNYNPNTILIFISKTENIDSRKKIYKLIKNNGKIVEFNKNINVFDYTKRMFEDYKITNETINLLIKRVGNDLNNLKNEAKKLMVYKIDEKTITNNDVLDLTSNNIDTNIFNFIDNIISKNKKQAIGSYHELLKKGEEPIKIIVMLANQFRTMYQVKVFTKKGHSEDNIANTLHMKRYPVHLAIQASYRYDENVLLENLEKLADLDIKIKTGEIDKDLALELYLLSL